ncbi:MAG: GtrA family protein [Candidatus Magasanikbacteria bacterium]
MIKIFLQKFWSIRVQFAKYFAIGISAVVLDICTLRFFVIYLKFNPVLAVVANQVLLLNFVFLLNKHWAFGSKGITHQQAIRFYMVAGMNYLIAISWMWFFTNLVNLHQYTQYLGISEPNYYLVVRTVNVALAVSWNFLLYKFFVYKPTEIEVINNPLD